MKIRKVINTVSMEGEEGNMSAGEVDHEAKAKTASLLGLNPSQPLATPHRRRAEEVARECAQEQAFSQETALPPKNEHEEVTWAWKRQSMQGLGSEIKLYYQKKVFNDIRMVLTAVGGEKILQQFLDGCFGHMMHFIGGTSCSKALHELISHEISLTGAREDELWFHISGTNIRFAPPEYALITGLHFGSFSFTSLGSLEMPQDGVYKRLFSCRPITVTELWKRFNSQDLHGSAEDYLKVAHILALYLMALAYGQRKTVEQWMWVLVEDLDLWNRFPWGAYTYQVLMHYVSTLPRTRAGLGSRYIFGGPVWALQIWAYEAIPQLGNICALVTGRVTMPRCLKWSFPKLLSIDFAHFFEQELVCSVTLDPTDEEQLQPYWLSVQTSQPLGVGSAPLRRLIATASRAKVAESSEDTSAVSESSSDEPANLVKVQNTDGSTPTPSACLKGTRASIRSSGNKHVPEIFDELFVDRVSSKVVDQLTKQLVPQMKQWMKDLFLQFHDQPLRWELKQKPGTSHPPRGAKICQKTKKRKKTRRSPSSSEEMSDDEGCESSSGDQRRRGMKKRCKKKKTKYSESSHSESDRCRRRRKRHNRRRSSSSEGSDQRHPRGMQYQHRSISLPE